MKGNEEKKKTLTAIQKRTWKNVEINPCGCSPFQRKTTK